MGDGGSGCQEVLRRVLAESSILPQLSACQFARFVPFTGSRTARSRSSASGHAAWGLPVA